ncbi:MAG: T9SS type A sorting domain-containing protein [Flavobacteriales bacterium]|nr:T9SS type A sorting domain-containing protein [Flavobacteriales bacterium]
MRYRSSPNCGISGLRVGLITFVNALCMVLVPILLSAQELVPNGGFEQYSNCPGNLGQLVQAQGWMNPSTNNEEGASPDFLHECSSDPDVDVPNNVFGTQSAYSGRAYAGLYAYSSNSEYREYIMVELTEPLVQGECYRFSMFVSLSEFSEAGVHDLGVHFSMGPLVQGQGSTLGVEPQLSAMVPAVVDTLAWTAITGTFEAQGGEDHLTIGNFADDASTQLVIFESLLITTSYYYVDDVSVSSCATGLPDAAGFGQVMVRPNPATDAIHVDLPAASSCLLRIFDLSGLEVMRERSTGPLSITVDGLMPGVYLYCITINNRSQFGRLVVQ